MKRYTPPEYTAKSTNHWYSRKKRRTAGHPIQPGCLPRPSPNPAHPGSPLPTHPARVWTKRGCWGPTVTKGIHGCEGAGLQLERGISGDTQSLLFAIAIGPPGGEGSQSSILHFSLPCPAHLSLPQPEGLRVPPSEHRSWWEVPSPQVGYPPGCRHHPPTGLAHSKLPSIQCRLKAAQV